MREGDKRVVNLKDGEMRGREERGRERLLSFSLCGGRLPSFPLHRERDERRGGGDSYPSPFIMGKIKGKEIGSSEKESGDGQ